MNKEISEEQVDRISGIFKILGNKTRLEILLTLMEKECCVNDISDQLGMNQSAVSHQLSILRTFKIVKYKRMNKKNCYSLADQHIYNMILISKEHIND